MLKAPAVQRETLDIAETFERQTSNTERETQGFLIQENLKPWREELKGFDYRD